MNVKINVEQCTITIKDAIPDLKIKVEEMKKYFEEKYHKPFEVRICNE